MIVLAELSRYTGEDVPQLGASVGIVEFDPECDEDTTQLVARADRAMYDVKAHNRQSGEVAIGAVPVDARASDEDDLVPLSDVDETDSEAPP